MRRVVILAALLTASACGTKVQWAEEPLERIRAEAKAGRVLLVDASHPEAWYKGHVPEALSLPLASLRSGKVRLGSMYFGRAVFVYAESGDHAVEAARLLKARGADARPLRQGFSQFASQTRLPTPPPSAGSPSEER